MIEAFVGIGGNIEPARHVPKGINALEARFGPLCQSTIWRSRAVGFDGDDFHNLVVAFTTELDIHALKSELDSIEDSLGRNRDAPRFGPRIIDLDLLLYGEQVIHAGCITIPRPEILKRAFVLQPLAEIAGDQRHPLSGQTYAEHWKQFESDEPALIAVSAS